MFKLGPDDVARIEHAVNLSISTRHDYAAKQLRCSKPGLVALFFGLREIGVTVPPHEGNKHRARKIRGGEQCPIRSEIEKEADAAYERACRAIGK